MVSKDIPFKSSEVYSPGFLLDLLKGLRIVNDANDIKALSKDEIDIIRSQKAWKGFQNTFTELNNQAQTLDAVLHRESKTQSRIDKVKKFVFGLSVGISSLGLSMIIDQLTAGLVMLPISLIFALSENIIGVSKVGNRMQLASTEKIIDGIVRTKEPFYVITNQIKQSVKKIDC